MRSGLEILPLMLNVSPLMPHRCRQDWWPRLTAPGMSVATPGQSIGSSFLHTRHAQSRGSLTVEDGGAGIAKGGVDRLGVEGSVHGREEADTGGLRAGDCQRLLMLRCVRAWPTHLKAAAMSAGSQPSLET